MESDSKGIKLSERLHMEDLLLGLCLGARYDDATFQLNTQCRRFQEVLARGGVDAESGNA